MCEVFSSDDSSIEEWRTDESGGEDGDSRSRSEASSYRAASAGASATTSELTLVRGTMNGPPRGTLRLDKTEARAGDVVGVYWSIPSVQASSGDWIGTFENGEEDMEGYLDYRLRGDSLSTHGHVTWTLNHPRFQEQEEVDIFFAIFRASNSFLARSSVLTVVRDHSRGPRPVVMGGVSADEQCTITVNNVSCRNLRSKLFGRPDPFLKLVVIPGSRLPRSTRHSQRIVTSPCFSSIHPQWLKSFEFEVVSTDILEIAVRDKFVASRPSFTHFLGRAKIPVSQLLRRRNVTLTFPLQKRLPGDRVSGTISLTVTRSPAEEGEGGGEGERGSEGGGVRGSDSQEERADDEVETPNILQSQEASISLSTPLEMVPVVPPASLHHQSTDNGPSNGGASVITGRETIKGVSLTRQLSEDQQLNSRLNLIRGMLCGEGPAVQSLYTHSSRQRVLGPSLSLTTTPPSPKRPFITTHSAPVPSSLEEDLPDNWEKRTTPSGCPLYFDHTHKTVSLDKPDEQTEHKASIDDITNFLKRSDRNVFCRQPSDPNFTPNLALRRSNTTPSYPTQQLSEPITDNILDVNPSSAAADALNQLDRLLSIEEQSEQNGMETENGTRTGIEGDIKEREGEGEREEGEEERGEEREGEKGREREGEKGEDRERERGPLTRISSIDPVLRDCPAFKFLTRPDLYKFAKEERNEMFFSDVAVLELVQTIRSDHAQFSRYQHNSRLVTLLNSFARTECQLPVGWDKKKDTHTGRIVFVDHHSQRTTFIDPRLPYPGNNLTISSTSVGGVVSRSRPHEAPDYHRRSRDAAAPSPPPIPHRPPHTLPPPPHPSSPQSYSERVVAFLSQPGIVDEIRTRYQEPINAEMRAALETIRRGGVPALERLQNDEENVFFDLMIIISLFEEEISHNIFPVATRNLPPLPTLLLSSPPPPPPPPPLLPSSLPPPPPPPLSPPPPPPPPPLPPSSPPPPPPPLLPPPSPVHLPRPHPPYVQLILGPTSPLHSPSPPPPPPPPPPPLPSLNRPQRHWSLGTTNQHSATNDTLSELDRENHTFSGVPTQQIMEYMRSNDAFRYCLGEFRIISPEHRVFFTAFAENTPVRSVEQTLAASDPLRQFVIRMLPGVLGDRHSTADQSAEIPTRRPWISRGPLSPSPHWSPSSSTDSSPSSPSLSLHSNPAPLPEAAAGVEGRAFIDKLQQLQRKLERNGYASSQYHHKMDANIRRDHLLEDAFRFIMTTKSKRLRQMKCSIVWDREEGLDYGGPQREFFFKLSRLLFNPYYGLFQYSAQGSYTLQICPNSIHIADALKWFRFAGRLVGYANIQGSLLDVFFARHVYKSLLGRSYTVQDVEAVDISFYNSLQYVLENDPSPLDLTFTVLEVNFGEMKERDLKARGSKISVTDENKIEYVELMTQWRLGKGITDQTDHFKKGFLEMLPLDYLSDFSPQELEWVIAGTADIDLTDWKNNTAYWGGYHGNSTVIKWFWEVVEEYGMEQRLKLLQFVTGTSSIPFEGFRALRGSNTIQQFTIDSLDYDGPLKPLPRAHTCFNRLDLPHYQTKEDLRYKLTLAIEECETFETA